MGQGLIAVTDRPPRLIKRVSAAADAVSAPTFFADPEPPRQITAPLATSFCQARRAAD